MAAELQYLSTTDPLRWVLPCPRGTEEVLADEVRRLGVDEVTIAPTAVHVRATLREGYRIALWSRVASRVLLPLIRWTGDADSALYDALRKVPWWDHFNAETTFSIGHSQAARDSSPAHFWVQRAKDAIVDAFRDHVGKRPTVDKRNPHIHFHLHVGSSEHEFALDFSGASHRRGYRRAPGTAPLKENLAAAILYLAGWPEAAEEGLTLLDPTCGSGTFLIEAALMASDCAPGLLRDTFGFDRWKLHDAKLFEEELSRAQSNRRSTIDSAIVGCDASSTALSYARQNLKDAGVENLVELSEQRLTAIDKPADRGVLVCNPPYGRRLGNEHTLFLFYQTLGDVLKNSFGGWTAYLFAAHNENLKHLGLRPTRRTVLYNGAIECRLLEIPIQQSSQTEAHAPGWRKPSKDAEMFANRIKKNRRKWERRAKRENLDCYRLYDADIPEYRVAVDRFGPKVLVHMYSGGSDTQVAQRRLQDVLLTLPSELGIEPDDIVVKVRQRHDEGDQYVRLADQEEKLIVQEGELRFVVNLQDRIDTGLFIDHRDVRAYAMKHCKGLRMLNLFAYTCSVSVAAAVGGAQETTSVDLSNTYLDWGRRNFEQNGLAPAKHRFIRQDAMDFVARTRGPYDWMFINPPTFSRSKKTKGAFNIHQHHGRLIDNAMRSLAPQGELLFTTHARDFHLDKGLKKKYTVEEASKRFVPSDFARSPFCAWTFQSKP